MNAEEVVRNLIHYVPKHYPVQEAFDLKPKSITCMFANGSETQVIVWSRHGRSKQNLLHASKILSSAKMGLIPKYNNDVDALESNKQALKVILLELAAEMETLKKS